MEKIFAVKSTEVARVIPMGLCRVDETQLLDWVGKNAQLYDRTAALEEDPTLMQLVAYVLVQCEGKLLFYQRAPKGDKRIQGKYSLAFGGHINSEDAHPTVNPVLAGRTRELAEEISLSCAPTFDFLGTLNINMAPIDRFHLGFVYRAQVDNPSYTLNEPEAFNWSHWASPEEIAEKFDVLESWSQAVFTQLYPALVESPVKALQGD